jgi:hypothetical protein
VHNSTQSDENNKTQIPEITTTTTRDISIKEVVLIYLIIIFILWFLIELTEVILSIKRYYRRNKTNTNDGHNNEQKATI